jgi:ATP-binding cassette, subfamily B, multidrug efflux pump
LKELIWTPSKLWRRHILAHPVAYLSGIVTLIITAIAQVAHPRLLGYAIDHFNGSSIPALLTLDSREESFLLIFAIYFCSHLALLLGRIGWRVTLARQTHVAGNWLRGMVWLHARHFPRHLLDSKYTPGTLMNASTSDVNASRFVFGFTLVGLFDVLFLGILTLWMMWGIDREMTIWALMIFPPLGWVMRSLAKQEIERHAKAQEYLAAFNDKSSQAVSTIKLQRMTQTGAFWEAKLNQSALEYRYKRLLAIFTDLRFYPLMGVGVILSYLILFIIGINKVFAGTMSVGDFVAMQSLVFLLQDPIIELGFVISDIQSSKASLRRLCDIYNQPLEQHLVSSDAECLKAAKSGEVLLKLKDVSFSYLGSEIPVLDNFNLELQERERVGICGPIGAGKSTLVEIMGGLERKLKEGTVSYRGEPFSSYSHQQLRQEISIVGQKPMLFADTIRNNIKLDRDLSDEQIWHYLKVAGVESDVFEFEGKLDCQLGEWGINLSGGQKQRLTIARALARQPKFLLLDDALSAVDTVTEEQILQAMDCELANSTVLWVAHRQSTLKYCNRIVELG